METECDMYTVMWLVSTHFILSMYSTGKTPIQNILQTLASIIFSNVLVYFQVSLDKVHCSRLGNVAPENELMHEECTFTFNQYKIVQYNEQLGVGV